MSLTDKETEVERFWIFFQSHQHLVMVELWLRSRFPDSQSKILWPAVQVISNMKLYKNIIPNHNRGKPFSFPHLPSSHCSKNLLHHGSDNHRNSESFHIMFSRMRSVSGLMVSLQISKVKQQLAPDYTEETWNEIFKNLLVSKLLWWPKDWEICLCDKRHSLLTY